MRPVGPFPLTGEEIYYVPSRPGVYILGNSEDKPLIVGAADDLKKKLSELASNPNISLNPTRFWYKRTTNEKSALKISGFYADKYYLTTFLS